MSRQTTLGLIAAMPEEIRPLLKRIGRYHQSKVKGFDCYHFSVAGTEAVLVRSGMGCKNAAAAAAVLIESVPSIIINFGFAGAVSAGPAVGDLVVAENLFSFSHAKLTPQQGVDNELKEKVLALLQADENQISCPGTFITAGEIVRKRTISGLVTASERSPVLEMETVAVAEAACRAGIPFAAVRAISDPADEELSFGIDEFTDNKLEIRIWRVLATVLKKPWIIPQLLRLARNTQRAGINLAKGIETAIRGV